MSWRDEIEPARMTRLAVVAPRRHLDEALAAVAGLGVVEPDLGLLEASGRAPDDASSAPLDAVGEAALQRGDVAALVGWAPESELTTLAEALAPFGASAVRLGRPKGVDPPTLLRAKGPTKAFDPVVETYSTVPYADLNPSLLAGLAYVAMFGMMFPDVGEGALVAAAGAFLLSKRLNPSGRFRAGGPFVLGAGLSSMGFGFAFGEAFGPTGLVPTLWERPLSDPTGLLLVSVAIGAGLLAVSYVLAVLNRLREGGAAFAVLALPGLAGASLYLGLALGGLGWIRHLPALLATGGVLAGLGAAAAFTGLYLQAGGRASGVAQASVELFDGVVRLGTNTISFARLAAFGLTHAALGQVVWRGTTLLWHRGPLDAVLAVGLFAVGTSFCIALEGLVAAVQALRLEYYELFSRIFVGQGRPFRAWHPPLALTKENPC